MSYFPLLRGAAARDSFVYQLPSGTFVTGKVQADFTITLSKNGAGSQSTTGITLTEDTTSIPAGSYALAFATTSFVSVVGEYNLVIYDTAAPRNSWSQVYSVTQSGSPGPVSNVFFQSSTSDGRAVDGFGIPLQGVSVYVKSGTQTLTVVRTDATGNFLFYADPGTYTLYYELAGYQQATATVAFTNIASTGPGTDIALQSIANNSTIVASGLWSYARQQSGDQTGALADTKVKRSVNSAQDMVAKDTLSNWWLRRAYLSLNGFQSFNATFTHGSTTVVLVTGSWPTWAISPARLNVGTSMIMDISSRTNATTIELTAAWYGVTGDYSAVLFQDTYALPINMYQFGRVLPGQRWGWGGDPVTAEVVWERQNAAAFGQQGPGYFAIYNGNVILGPYPATTLNTLFTFHARPVPLVNAGDIADIDPAQIALLYRAIDCQVAVEFGQAVAGDAPACMMAYKEEKARSANTDRSPTSLPSVNRIPGMSGTPTFWQAPRAP